MRKSTTMRRFGCGIALLLAATLILGCQPAKEDAAEPQPEPTFQRTAGPEPVPEPEPQPEPEPPAEPEPEPVAKPEPRPEPEPEPEPEPDPQPEPQPGEDPQARKAPDLGPPLVEKPENLAKLDEERPLWVDRKEGTVVMVGRVCQTDAPLELFACLDNTKEHEAIVSVGIKAYAAHAGLLAVGAEAGHAVKFDPKYVPAKGTEIEVLVAYKEKDGKIKRVRAQEWIYDMESKKAMEHVWVFAGSGFWEDEDTKTRHYMAEGGDFICVSNFSSAMLDLPIESSQANSALMFKAFTERIPPIGTPVTVILKPKKGEEE